MEFIELGIRISGGKERQALECPKCKDAHKTKRKCLTVNNEPGNRWWNCHRCGWSGNLDLLNKYEKVKEKSKIPKDVHNLKSYSQSVTSYIKKRGFSVKTLTDARVYETKNNIIGFPFYQSQTLVNVKFLKLDDKSWFQMPKDTGPKRCFWGLGEFEFNKELDEVIITEGEWDRLTWMECGYKNVLSVPQGAPSPSAKDFHKEFGYVNDPYFKGLSRGIKVFYLSVDDDDPGYVLQEQLALRLGKEKCRIINYPKGYKDINNVLKGTEKLKPLGKEGVKECHTNARSYPLKGIIKPSQLYKGLKLYREEGFIPGLGIGIPEINYMWTVKPKHISFWTGLPGIGKSVFLRWYLIELIRHNFDLNLKFAMFTPEERPPEREYAKMAEVITGQSIRKDAYNSMSNETYRKTMNFLEKHFSIIAPDRWNYETFDGKIKSTDINTLKSILGYVKYLAKTEGIFGYVIDAWNKINHEQPRYMSETNYLSEQLDMLIDFNTYYNVHSFIVAHPTKLSKDKAGNYDMPSLYDIKGTSAWNEKADIGVIVHRKRFRPIKDFERRGDEDDREYVARSDAPLIVKSEKIRFEELGTTGIVRMNMNNEGGFDIHPDDEGIHKKKKPKKKKEEDKKQTKLPYKDDDFDEDEVPF